MGPKKDPKKDAQKRDQNPTVDEPLNTDSWRCVVVMAVERTSSDCFVMREFMEEFSNGRRREIGLVDFDSFVMKILTDFASGDLQHKYASLLNFSSILLEASEYVSKSAQIPMPVLAKVIKVILFYLKEESLIKIEKKAAGPPDPIVAMAERPANFGTVENKKKEATKKKDDVPKVRPQSTTKQDTRLLKRGEKVKDDQCIDDAPLNGYFSLYVLLTGFYHPDFPLELIKVGIPLHGLLCIDTSLSGVREEAIRVPRKYLKQNSEEKEEHLNNFWDTFLKILWDPKVSPHFKDTIFQVYVPRSMRCDKKKLREFIYREISYLMYDLSDFKKQLNNYLNHMKMWDVEEKEIEKRSIPGLEELPNECATVPLVLQCMIDAVCGDDWNHRLNFSSNSIDSVGDSEWSDKSNSISAQAFKSSMTHQNWSQILNLREDFDSLKVFSKAKELDVMYNLDHRISFSHGSDTANSERGSSQMCDFQFRSCGENMKEALAAEGTLRSYWKKHGNLAGTTFVLDYCLYPVLMTRVLCPYLTDLQSPPLKSNSFFRKNSNFELISNLSSQMRKPHFTVTDSSRSILRALPFNMKDTSRDFFSPVEFKIVSPEKLKASSAPQFRITPGLKVQNIFTSQVLPSDIPKNLFENIREFLGDGFFAASNGFDFLEYLGKQQFIEKKNKYWDHYNCVDHTYSVVNDCIFLALHNRMDNQNVHHETFNEVLKTGVGLRDFYEYVLDDESEWFANQETALRSLALNKEKSLFNQLVGTYSDADFWLVNSIKYQQGDGYARDLEKYSYGVFKGKSTSALNQMRMNSLGDFFEVSSYDFEGYNVSDMAVQFSGLKTVYYSNDCSMTVELIERLYGNQDLGIHITADGHTLHLYSYVCPEPHILDPFTFHITYKNGVIVAFGRRFIETFEEVEEIIESRTAVKGKKNSSELSTRIVKKLVPKTVRDEEFVYDMAVSLPNGLSVRTVRKAVKPCYIKQLYLSRIEKIAQVEISRLFLPNGNVIKMLSDGTVEILKPDTSIVTAALDDLVSNDDSEGVQFKKFHIISGEGFASTFEQGKMTSPKRFQILQNSDLDANLLYFRRRDGTNYMLNSDGTLCTEFKDGTKISSSIIVNEEGPVVPQSEEHCSSEMSPQEEKTVEEDDLDRDFVFVYTKTIMEHPEYATVIYDTKAEKWSILLPQDSTITVDADGQYSVDIDRQTSIRAESNAIQMSRYGNYRRLECAATADLSVFENSDGNVYCHMEDVTGKIFIVEVNSNCYILEEERASEVSEVPEIISEEAHSQQSDISEFVASADLQFTPSVHTEKWNKLSPRSKYFVLKRDMTGFELLHADDVNKVLTEKKNGSLLFTETIPGRENRIFVLITPVVFKGSRKWQVSSILPKPKYVPQSGKKQTSTTYGCPPSWMHPFPKRKNKFEPPDHLSCRVFIETKRTELSPPKGEIDCYYCEVDEMNEVPNIQSEGIEEYLKKLSRNDQDLLRDLYTVVADSLINEKKKLKPVNSEKLEHYLKLSNYHVELQEYHKHCIRYHSVPNYFHHPAGMSWLILNDLINRLQIQESASATQEVSQAVVESSEKTDATFNSLSAYSYEEIEYNMSQSDVLSFSDLSYRSNVSAHTAPAVLKTGGVCRCKVSGMKGFSSAPVVKCYEEEETSVDDLQPPRSRECDFLEDDLEMLDKTQREMPLMTLEDLMCLGLI